MHAEQERNGRAQETAQTLQNTCSAIRLVLLQVIRWTEDNTLSGTEVETGMSMAVVGSNKTQDFNYHLHCIQSFLMECGRVQAVLSNTVLQPDQEEHLVSLLKATAAKLGDNVTVRQSPSYSSQTQGSVERFHRTLYNGKSENVETTTWSKLRHQHHQPTSNHTVPSLTFSILPQQMCSTCRWKHHLLRNME